jgi:hypothetical protein
MTGLPWTNVCAAWTADFRGVKVFGFLNYHLHANASGRVLLSGRRMSSAALDIGCGNSYVALMNLKISVAGRRATKGPA